MRLLFLSMLFVFAFIQCKHEAPPSSDQQANTDEPVVADRGLDEAPAEALKILTFICQTVMDEYENPHSQVFIQINNSRVKIADISACDIINGDAFAQYEIPSNALAACGGWWAGAGDYFYAIQEGNHIKVMKGWQDESQTDKGFHYELTKDIDLTGLQ